MLNSNLCGFTVWFSHYHHLDQYSTTSTPIPPYNFHSIFQDREIKVLQLAYLMKDVAFRKYFHDFLNNLKPLILLLFFFLVFFFKGLASGKYFKYNGKTSNFPMSLKK